MFCQNCGNQIDEGLRFCGKCGAPVSSNDVYSSTNGGVNEVPFTAPDEPVVQPEENQGFNVNVPDGEVESFDNSFLNMPKDPPKKKKGKLFKILAVILAILIVLGSCGFLFRDYIANLWYWTKPNDEKLQYAFYKQAATTTGNIADVYSDIIDAANDEYAVEGTVSVEVAKTLLGLTGGNIPNSLSLNYKIDYTPGMYAATVFCNVGNDSVLTLEYWVDIENAVATVRIPELNKQAIQIDISDFEEIYDIDEEVAESYDDLFDTEVINKFLPDEKLIENLAPRLIEVAFMEISEVSDEKRKFTAGGVTEELTLLTADITEDTVIKMIIAMLEELKTNADVKEYVNRLADTLNEFSDVTGETFEAEEFYSSYTTALDQIIAEGKETKGSEEVVAQLRTYIDFGFNIKAIEFEIPDEDILFSYGETAKGNKRGTELKLMYDDTTVFSIVGSGTEKSNKFTGSISLYAALDEYELSEILVIKCDKYNLKTAKDGIYSGKIEIFLGDDVLSYVLEDAGYGSIGKPSLLFNFADKKNSIDRSISFKFNGIEMVTIRTTSSESDKANIVLPENSTTDVEEWAKGLSLDYFKDLMEKWGIPLDAFGTSEPSYDDYYNDYYGSSYDDYFEYESNSSDLFADLF